MKTLTTILLLTTNGIMAQNGVLDLTSLQNYANQSRPSYITRDNTPATNPITNQGATLGRVLFYDKRLSRNDTVSCASCHQQSNAFSDQAVASTGVSGTTSRHSVRLINARFANESKFFWDERAASAEAQATQPIRNHAEMGFSGTSGDPDFSALVSKVAAIEEYRVLFTFAFGSSTVNEDRIQKAIAQFVRSIQSFDSKYDAGRAVANDNQAFPNFTASENAGKALFLNPPGPGGGAGCAGCHAPPEFDIDPNSLNNGVIAAIGGGTDLTNTRSPSLRDVVKTSGATNGPFMHNGSFTSLNQVINHYNAIPGNNTNLDPRLRVPGGGVQNLNLTQTQKDNLVSFLRTLSGTNVYTDVKWSNPFNTANQLTLIILPTTANIVMNNVLGTVTVSCTAAPSLSYQLEASEDLQNWTTLGTVSSSAQGALSQTIAKTGTKRFFRYTYTPPAS